MGKKSALMIFATLLVGTLLVMAKVPNAKATTQTIHLYGSFAQGWGFTPDTMSKPGPDISVAQGDLVNLTLTGEDAFAHVFFVDYNGNHTHDAGEPESSSFAGTTINFQFTAGTTGTFTYYCANHPSDMHGTFSVTVIPEFQPFLLIPIYMMVTLLVILVWKRFSGKPQTDQH
jgi:plastocyanin